MANKFSLTQVKKYNINHKILESLASLESRIILFSIIKSSKTAEDIAKKENIPQSTVYSKLHELEDLGLICVEKTIKSGAGRLTKFYQSRISSITMNLNSVEPHFILTPVSTS
ncbi:MAG: winged helix-turn-helix domain-containing protein [Nitrosarchaeum sp.]|nr:winged helix-turn-helix domain-containing protein [Nitrosarchaeum sp.]MCV0398397.1 winged helix-turn-helix domain-containing protein [Nitrosarchaeum sp.]